MRPRRYRLSEDILGNFYLWKEEDFMTTDLELVAGARSTHRGGEEEEDFVTTDLVSAAGERISRHV